MEARREYAELAARYHRRWAAYTERSLALLRPYVADADLGRVLDVGCGTAALLPPLLRWNARVHRYVGVDASAEMLGVARRKLPSGAVFAADAAALPLADESIDTLISASSLHDWPRPDAALAEARRVLAPGGRLLLIDWCRDGVRMKLLNGWMRLTGKRYRRMYSAAEAAGLLRRAGFRVVRQERRWIGLAWRLMLFECEADPHRRTSDGVQGG